MSFLYITAFYFTTSLLICSHGTPIIGDKVSIIYCFVPFLFFIVLYVDIAFVQNYSNLLTFVIKIHFNKVFCYFYILRFRFFNFYHGTFINKTLNKACYLPDPEKIRIISPYFTFINLSYQGSFRYFFGIIKDSFSQRTCIFGAFIKIAIILDEIRVININYIFFITFFKYVLIIL